MKAARLTASRQASETLRSFRLVMDEFALWLNLRDVYWSPERRASIDAIILFGAMLAAGSWDAPLFKPGMKQRQTTGGRQP